MAEKRRSRTLKTVLEETGFGSKSFSDLDRLIKKDGSFNVRKRGAGLKGFSFYYWLINLHWLWLLLYGIIGYFVINLLFAVVYFLAGREQLIGGEALPSSTEFFLHCFYFSTQTLTTLGYGFISPVKGLSSAVAAFEAMIGLLTFAFATSVLYGRFSKAKSKIIFSDSMVVSPYRGITGLKFRIANPRRSEIIELKTRVIYSYLEEENEQLVRRYVPLELEIDFINLFPLPWTIVHPISKESPMAGKAKAQLIKEQTEFIILLKGYDEAFNQDVHQIRSYRGTEVLFGHDFEPMFDRGFESSTTVQLDLIDKTRKVTI